MIFCASPSASVEVGAVPGAKPSVDCVADGAAGAGTTDGATATAGGSSVARMREMGGRNERLVAASPSARFGRVFFSSISETVSSTGFAVGGGGGTSLGACSACDVAG